MREPLFPDGWLVNGDYVDEDLGTLRSGKEGEVRLVARSDGSRASYLVEKRFVPHERRGFQRERRYWEDWLGASGREQRAIRKSTRKGHQFLDRVWILHEWESLRRAYRAGVTVPPPVELVERGYRMAFIGDDGVAAPRLADLRLPADEALPLYRQLLREVALLLAADRVHGDLSAYNVLVWRGRAVLIDFSQTVDVITHPLARALLRRDVERLCDYFRRCGLDADASEALAAVGDRPALFGRP